MHDLSHFRANLDAIALRLATRGFQLNVEEFRALDSERRAAITESEQLKAQKNAESAEIAKLRKQGLDAEDRQQKVRSMSERTSSLDDKGRDRVESFGPCWRAFRTFRMNRCRWARPPRTMSKCGAGASRASLISNQKRTGTWVPSCTSWIWSGPPRSLAPDSRFTGAWARG